MGGEGAFLGCLKKAQAVAWLCSLSCSKPLSGWGC